MARGKRPVPAIPPQRAKRRLSPRGRQRLGEFVANSLMGAAALLGSTMIVPGVLREIAPPEELFLGGLTAFTACVAAALLIRYITEEHEGEKT